MSSFKVNLDFWHDGCPRECFYGWIMASTVSHSLRDKDLNTLLAVDKVHGELELIMDDLFHNIIQDIQS